MCKCVYYIYREREKDRERARETERERERCISAHCITLHCISLHYMTLHCLHYIASELHSTYTSHDVACIHVYIQIYIHTYIHTYIHAYMHTCIHAYMHTCTWDPSSRHKLTHGLDREFRSQHVFMLILYRKGYDLELMEMLHDRMQEGGPVIGASVSQ